MIAGESRHLRLEKETKYNLRSYSGPSGIPPKVGKLFGLLELLYGKGARNFLLIDLPPIHRSPAGKQEFPQA